MTTDQQTPSRLIGVRQRRSDSPERLTGQTRFNDDLRLPGLLHARLVRSPYASARITRIDVAAAEALPGVFRVLTARDLPVVDLEGLVESGTLLLALERVLYVGHAVAVVLGETEAAAEDGMYAVEVEYEPLEPVVDPLDSLAPDAIPVRQKNERDEAELAMHGASTQGRGQGSDGAASAPNVTSRTRFERGDVEAGFADCAAIVEREFRTSWLHQAHIEPQTCTATTEPLGNVVVYACTQALFRTRDTVARVLGLETGQVRVIPMPVGGGFGGKFGLIEATVAALAKAAGRPVRLTYTRSEEFTSANPAPSSIIRVKAGARADGTLVALTGDIVVDAGAKAGSPAGQIALMLGAFYRWENLRIEATEVITHKTPQGAYRGPGAPQGCFAAEAVVDELARELGIDPFDIRVKNAVRKGDPRPDRVPWDAMGLHECLERARPIYDAERAAIGPNEGVGVALGGWFGGLESSSALCRLESNGTLRVALGSIDLTGTNSTFEIIAAEAFGFETAAKVRVTTADTDSAPYAGATGGSKALYTIGPSVKAAAEDARHQVLRIAAAELEAAVEDLEIVGNQVRVKGVPGKVKTLSDISRVSAGFGAKYPPVLGRGQSAVRDRAPGTGVHVVRVRVDPETGRVVPLRYVIVQDVGTAINPATVEDQIFGGGAQGVGWGLYEQIVHDENGTPVTASFADYTLPTAVQVPEFEAVLVEVPAPAGPFGAKQAGEPPVIPGGGVISNAVRDAAGVRLTHLPITPERVLAALAERAPASVA